MSGSRLHSLYSRLLSLSRPEASPKPSELEEAWLAFEEMGRFAELGGDVEEVIDQVHRSRLHESATPLLATRLGPGGHHGLHGPGRRN